MQKKVFLNCVPLLFHLLCTLLWLFEGKFLMMGMTSSFEIIASVIIIPIYLVAINVGYIKLKINEIIVSYLYMTLVSLIGSAMTFFNWWISGGRIGMIDPLTKTIMKLQAEWSFYFLTFLWIIVNVIRLIIFKRKKEA